MTRQRRTYSGGNGNGNGPDLSHTYDALVDFDASELKNRYLGALTKIAGSRDEAEDVLQTAYFRACRAASSGHGYSQERKNSASFGTWLFQIARNEALNRLRKRKLSIISYDEPFGDDGDTMLHSLPGNEPGPEEVLLGQELSEVIENQIASLPFPYKCAILLRDVEGLRYDACAEIMSVPLGTMKSRTNRARQLLREKLHKYLQDGDPDEKRKPLQRMGR